MSTPIKRFSIAPKNWSSENLNRQTELPPRCVRVIFVPEWKLPVDIQLSDNSVCDLMFKHRCVEGRAIQALVSRGQSNIYNNFGLCEVIKKSRKE